MRQLADLQPGTGKTDARDAYVIADAARTLSQMLHVSYTVEGTWLLLKRHGWFWQQPARRAIERDDGWNGMSGGVTGGPGAVVRSPGHHPASVGWSLIQERPPRSRWWRARVTAT